MSSHPTPADPFHLPADEGLACEDEDTEQESGVELDPPVGMAAYTPVPLLQVGLREALRLPIGQVRLLGITGHPARIADLGALQPDVVLLDMTSETRRPLLPRHLDRLRRVLTPARLLALVDPDPRNQVRAALAQRVTGVVARDATTHDLVAAIRSVGHGSPVFQAGRRPRPWPVLVSGTDTQITPRERQVLYRIAQGLNTHQIGQELGIADATVKFHQRQLSGKMGTTRRVDLVYRAVQEGILPLDLPPAPHIPSADPDEETG